ncbi:MAG: MoaD/ThiS family protein [Sideroxyarcus sp.]|nr:MoaD/ThiS family protein [Sideroxyarcus sp.]
MKIKLRLYATLQKYLPPGTVNSETTLELPEAATIPDALGVLAVPMTLPHIIFINGRHVLRPEFSTRQLQDGDILGVFPAIGGG